MSNSHLLPSELRVLVSAEQGPHLEDIVSSSSWHNLHYMTTSDIIDKPTLTPSSRHPSRSHLCRGEGPQPIHGEDSVEPLSESFQLAPHSPGVARSVTGRDCHRQGETVTDRERQSQTGRDCHRQGETVTDRERQSQTGRDCHRQGETFMDRKDTHL